MDTTIERTEGWRRHRPGAARRIALTALVLAALGPLAVRNAAEALGASASGRGGFASGTVDLRSDAGGALFRMPNVAPGHAQSATVTIQYLGSIPAGVHLYARTSGTGLAQFLTVSVTRGTGEGSGFIPDPIDYVGAGPGVLYRGPLADFPTRWTTGIVDPGTWGQGETHAYRFTVRLADAPAAQGLVAEASFRWEARAP